MTGVAVTFMGAVWIAILGTATMALRKIVSAKR